MSILEQLEMNFPGHTINLADFGMFTECIVFFDHENTNIYTDYSILTKELNGDDVAQLQYENLYDELLTWKTRR